MCEDRNKHGWISLHRRIQDHWIWSENRVFSKFEAWIDLLFEARFEDIPQKITLKGKLYMVNRGESIKSLETWAKRWNWSRSKVYRFFNLLKKDGMIEFKCDTITTHLTILNYNSYQDKRTTNEQQTNITRTTYEHQANIKRTQNNKENNDNKENKENKEINKPKNEFSVEGEKSKISNSNDYLSKLEAVFAGKYKEARGYEYESVTSGKDRQALGKLAKQYKEKHPTHSTEQAIIGLSDFFAKCMSIEDKFIRENMSPMTIVNQMPKINSILKNNGTANNRMKILSPDELMKIIK